MPVLNARRRIAATMLPTAALDYDLPPERIAQRPAEPRDSSRLMVISRTDPSLIEHRCFRDLPDYLKPSDLLITNRSAVLPARIAARRADTDGKVEGLFLAEIGRARWRLLLKANTRLRPGQDLVLTDSSGARSVHVLHLLERDAEAWIARLRTRTGAPDPTPAHVILNRIGATPLPPYILAARRAHHTQIADDADRRWYQTVYADPAHAGSVAAPTAGLHFTPDLLARIDARGVRRATVFLDVGPGTFKPIDTETAEAHRIHAEHVQIPPETLAALDDAAANHRRRICVGTTSVRAVESLATPPPSPDTGPINADTSLYILPGFRFRHTDALITNFHLPRSTLLALVGAFLEGSVQRLLDLYRVAIEHEYRFYSYGDAMLILP